MYMQTPFNAVSGSISCFTCLQSGSKKGNDGYYT